MGDADLEIVDGDRFRHAAKEGEQPDMRRQPVLAALGPVRLGPDQPRARQADDEDLRRPRPLAKAENTPKGLFIRRFNANNRGPNRALRLL
jgi:hypothetical protein